MRIGALHEYNLKHEDSLTQIKEIIELNKSYYTDVRIRCASIRQEEEWFNGLIMIKVFSKDDKFDKKDNFYYDNFHLLEYWIKPKELLSFLKKLKNEEIEIANDKVFIGQNTNLDERKFLHRNSEYSTLPGYLYLASSSQERRISIPFQVLLSHKFPFYPNIYRAIEDWAELSHFHDRSDHRFHKILLFLPECRAYFDNLKYTSKENSLFIKTKMNDTSLKLYVKGAYLSKSKYKRFDKKLNSSAEVIKINPDDANNIEEFELYLIDEDDCLLDYHNENRFNVKGINRVFGKTVELKNENIIKDAISMGENEWIEFKPYIKKGNHKINEILETVIAFANTIGGYILMGIDKYGQIEGIEKEIKREANKKQSKNFDNMLQEYIGYIKKEISDTLNEVLPIKINQHEYNGRTLLIIEVPEGEYKPYANIKTKDIFIRKGANNMKPDPKTELPKLYRFENGRF